VASIVGGTWLDLSEAQLAAPEVTLTIVSLVGGTRIMVPPGIRVEASDPRSDPRAGGPAFAANTAVIPEWPLRTHPRA
jgi:hypothetical protein